MLLTDVLHALPQDAYRLPHPAPTIRLTGITADSRRVEPGMLFVAVPGAKADGAAFIADALAKGAAAVASASFPRGGEYARIETSEPRRFLALAAAAWFGAQPSCIAGITGTDGKTSTAHFLRQLWHLLGKSSASIGTLGVIARETPQDRYPKLNTTPDPVLLHGVLSDLAKEGVSHVAMEASSIGIEQHRADGVAFKAAAFTNLTPEHLDYHGDMERYFACKALLFTDLLPADGVAVIRADDAYGARLAAMCQGRRVITFGEREGCDWRVSDLRPQGEGLTFTLHADGAEHRLFLPLYGHFQAWNVVTALALAHGLGERLERTSPLLSKLTPVPGRLERVRGDKAVFVDYAHTPGALENVLKALRPHTRGKLFAVFGCGGDRDPAKRRPMGEIAARLADQVIVTDDNPRSEKPEAIRAEILRGCPQAEEIGDRALAIRRAVSLMRGGDVLVVAGKGHEKEQIIGGRAFLFDDVAEAEAAQSEAA